MRTCLTFFAVLLLSQLAEANSKICVGNGIAYQSEDVQGSLQIRQGEIVYQHVLWINGSPAEHYIFRSGESPVQAKFRVEFDDNTKRIVEQVGDRLNGSVKYQIKMRITRPDGGNIRDGQNQIVIKIVCVESWAARS
ncbi:MAG TPA: hypothetical protein VFV50_17600 [Bdellovibrionales bacterium]|nr:hypothetical protein [Bdellovibrionales bacterium]